MGKAKAKGTRAETKVVKYLELFGIEAERKALHGSSDEGDVRTWFKGREEICLEVKAGKQTDKPNRTQMERWIAQCRVEAANSACECYLVVVRYNRGIQDAEVYLDNGDESLTMWYLDEFAKMIKV